MMPLPGPSAMAADALQGLPLLEAISGIFGSISMVAWIFVIVRRCVLTPRWSDTANLPSSPNLSPTTKPRAPTDLACRFLLFGCLETLQT